MNESEYRLLYVLTDLIFPLLFGYYLHQRDLISPARINQAIQFNIIFIFTALSLMSFWVLPLSWNLALLPVFGIAISLLPYLIGHFFFVSSFSSYLDRGAYAVSAMLSNVGTLGGVCAFILYQEAGFAYAQMIGTCQSLLLVLVAFPLAQHYYMKHTGGIRKTSLWHNFCDLFLSKNQICLLGMGAGLLLNLYQVPRPEILGLVFPYFVHIGAWIGLLPVGYLINLKRARVYLFRTNSLLAMRLFLLPFLLGGSAYLIFDDPVLIGSILVFAACPTGINAVIASRLYHLNVNLTISNFLATTALFLLIVYPVLFYFLHRF